MRGRGSYVAAPATGFLLTDRNQDMLTPLDMGLAFSRAGAEMMTGWLRLGETMSASHRVVERRGALLGDMARDPFAGDYAELGRMVPEKLSAVAAAGTSWIEDCAEVQRQLAAQVSDATRFVASGGAHPVAFFSRSADRSSRAAATTMRAGARALAPVHRAATGNARRLKV